MVGAGSPLVNAQNLHAPPECKNSARGRRRSRPGPSVEREESLILLSALEAFREVPLVTVWDNPKTVSPARGS